MKSSNKELVQDTLWTLAGNITLAMGVARFILSNDVLTEGLAGVAIALEPLIYLNPELVINVPTVVLFPAESLVLGKKFVAKTILSIIRYPSLLTLLPYLTKHVTAPDTFTIDKYLATIYGGVLIGIGVGCVFRTGVNTGGMDIPPLIINKYTHIPLPTLVLTADALTVLFGVTVYGLQATLTGVLSVWASSYTINKTMTIGGHDARNAAIVSNKHTETTDRTHEVLERRTTTLEATGGYSSEKRSVIMAVISKKQLPELEHLVSHTDPEAFVIVMEANEIQGPGFTYEEELQLFLYNIEVYGRRRKHTES